MPIIANFQTDIATFAGEFGYGILGGLAWAALRRVHALATLTLTPSHFMLRRLRDRGFVDQRLWVRGVDHEVFRPARYSSRTRAWLLGKSFEETRSDARDETKKRLAKPVGLAVMPSTSSVSYRQQQRHHQAQRRSHQSLVSSPLVPAQQPSRIQHSPLQLSASSSPLLALYVGRLAPEKHVDLLLQTAQLPGVHLAIVGDGPSRTELERLFAGTHTRFFGMLGGEMLPQVYASADVFVFTGTTETAGNVVREALASGTPAILPNAGGVVDMVIDGFNGFLCEPEGPAFAKHVTRLRDDRALLARIKAQTAEFGRNVIPSWQDVMEALEHYYDEAKTLASQKKSTIKN
eukprot:UC1_evm4s1677